MRVKKEMWILQVAAVATLGVGGCAVEAPPDEGALATPQLQIVESDGRALTTTDFVAADLQLVMGIDPQTDFEDDLELVAYVEPKGNARLSANLTTYCGQLPQCPTLTIRNQSGNASPLPAHDQSFAVSQDVDVQAYAAGAAQGAILMIQTNSGSDSDLGAGITAAVNAGAKVISGSWTLPANGASAVHSAISAAPSDVRFVFPVASVPSGDGGQAAPTAPTDLARVHSVGGMVVTINGATVSRSVWALSSSGYINNLAKPTGQTDLYGNGFKAFPESVNLSKGVKFRVATSSTTSADATLDGTAIGSAMDVVPFARDAALLNPFGLAAGRKLDITSGSNGTCGTFCNTSANQDAPSVIGQLTAK